MLTSLSVALLAWVPALVPQRYTVLDLGALPGGAEAWAHGINDVGQVAGSAQYDAARRFYHAARWEGGAFQDLGQLDALGFHSFATAINNHGHVVGGSLRASGALGSSDRAFVHDGVGMTALGALSVNGSSFAFDINDAGVVVGLAGTGASFGNVRLAHAVLWSGAVITDLGTLGGLDSRAHAVNESSAVVGSSLLADGALHAFLWTGAMRDLGTLGGASSEAWDINERGQVVGHAQNASGVRRAFLYEGGSMRDLGALPGARASEAYGVQATGRVVGTSWVAALGPRAVLWEEGTIVDLNERLREPSAWVLQVARSINARGQIVGYGRLKGATRAFMLVPRS